MELKTETNSNNKINDIGARVSLNETFSGKKKTNKQNNRNILLLQ